MNIDCKKCDAITVPQDYDLKEYCSKISFWGFSFFGGVKFYTFRSVLLFLGIKKKAIPWECLECGQRFLECPYCGFYMDYLFEKCGKCKKSYYICW